MSDSCRHLSKTDLSALLDFIYELTQCDAEESYKGLISGLKALLPFDYATSGLAKIDENGIKESFIIVNISYPGEWLDLYVKSNFNLVDPIVKENFTKFTIQYWPDTYKRHAPPKDFVYGSNDFGLLTGYTNGIRNLRGTEGSLLSISGKSIEKSLRTEIILKNIVPQLHQTLERLVKHKKGNSLVPLSKREQEILKWAANGKSNWDISIILGISERTVEFHLTNIMQKLDAVNRSHAVAIALDIGLIEFD